LLLGAHLACVAGFPSSLCFVPVRAICHGAGLSPRWLYRIYGDIHLHFYIYTYIYIHVSFNLLYIVWYTLWQTHQTQPTSGSKRFAPQSPVEPAARSAKFAFSTWSPNKWRSVESDKECKNSDRNAAKTKRNKKRSESIVLQSIATTSRMLTREALLPHSMHQHERVVPAAGYAATNADAKRLQV
jgi:hypothetical protein